MATEYYYVRSATSTDIDNSVHKTDSPVVKEGSDEIYLLTYTNGYVPSGGVLEYHEDKKTAFNGATKTSTNKVPDPFARENIRRRGREVMEAFFTSMDKPISSRHLVMGHIAQCILLLDYGDAAAALKSVEDITPDTHFTSTDQTTLAANITEILDDYSHLKDV